MGILDGKRILVTGVITDASIAFHVARVAQQEGATVVLTGFGRLSLVERIARRLPSPPPVLELDVTSEEHLASLASRVSEHVDGLDGVLHAIAYANPEEALGGNFLHTRWPDVATAIQVSAYSLKAVTMAALPLMNGGGSVVGLDFDASVAWPGYDWMGVAKAGLESCARYLARDLGEKESPGEPGGRRSAAHHGREVHPGLRPVRGRLGHPGAARLEHHRPRADRAGLRGAAFRLVPRHHRRDSPRGRRRARGGGVMPAAAGGQASTEYVLTLSCPDRVGIVHAVAAYLHLAGCNVLDSQQFGDRIGGRFFMRVHVETVPGAPVTYESLYGGFAPVAAEFGMEWELHDTAVQPRVLIMVSKAGHCLNDLLYRRAAESLRIDVPLVVGNHPDLAPLAAAHGVPFEHVPADPASAGPASAGSDPLARQRSEGRLLDLVSELDIDFVVLARYMRILSPELCAKMTGRIINIHHSFLPSFKGARPYHQAHAHGVKLIGATAHYVTADLDEGPIIEQEVARVDHSDSPEDLAAIGRDAERVALARAVRWHAEHRVLLHGRRTVIFR